MHTFTEIIPYYSFHLPLFVFVSGYFYQQSSQCSTDAYLIKKIKNLIIPLYFWNIFYAAVLYAFKRYGFFPRYAINYALIITPITESNLYQFNLAGWFVFPLFLLQIFNFLFQRSIAAITRNKIKVHELCYFILYLVLGVLAVRFSLRGFNTGWWAVLNRMLYFLPFYALGTLYQKYEKYDRLDSAYYFAIVIAVALCVIYQYGRMPTMNWHWLHFTQFKFCPPLALAVCVIGIAFWLRVAKILAPAIGESPHIKTIANNSFAIMLHHLLGFKLICSIFAVLNLHGFCQDFNWHAYKTSIWYCYVPHKLAQFKLLYVIGGVLFSLMLQKLMMKLVKRVAQICQRRLVALRLR